MADEVGTVPGGEAENVGAGMPAGAADSVLPVVGKVPIEQLALVVVTALLAFLAIISISKLMEGGSKGGSKARAMATPKKKALEEMGTIDTPQGRRSTRRRQPPQKLEPGIAPK